MTNRQSFAIFSKTGYDVRSIDLTQEQINTILTSELSVAIEYVKTLGGILKNNVKYEKSEITFKKIYNKALNAGYAAVEKMIKNNEIVPMTVVQHSNMLDDNSPIKKSWYVEDGVCGFVWVNIKPANTSFAKWLVKNDYAKKDSYYGGITIWISQYGQSMQKKSEFAKAFSTIINEYGFKSYADSRMD
jgi:hypothetical protein